MDSSFLSLFGLYLTNLPLETRIVYIQTPEEPDQGEMVAEGSDLWQ